MANYEAKARSNYFLVKDPDAFIAMLEKAGLSHERRNVDDRFMVYREEEGWPHAYYDDDKSEDVDFDIAYDTAEHLIAGEVAIFVEVGSEKMLYLNGYAVAVNSNGEQLSIDIGGISAMVKAAWGVTPTDPSY